MPAGVGRKGSVCVALLWIVGGLGVGAIFAALAIERWREALRVASSARWNQ
jgi:hypothetical protein